MLPSIIIDYIQETPIQLPLAETISFYLQKFSKERNKKFPKFELGLIGKIGANFLLNEMTSEGLRNSSTQGTRLELTGNIGLVFGVKITPREALTLQATPYAPIKPLVIFIMRVFSIKMRLNYHTLILL